MARSGEAGARPGHSDALMCLQLPGNVIPVTAREMPRPYSQGMTTANKPDRAAWLQGPSARCTTVPEGTHPPTRIVLLGAPGVGKGTQAELLNARLNACHLSTGDVFRAAGNRPDCDQSPAMKEALGYMRRGELVPDSTVWEMVRERLECLRCGGGFILDGFPRTLGQAQSLQALLNAEGLDLTAVISYDLPFGEIVPRLGGRRTCGKCKTVYHLTERPSKVEGKCDHCGSSLFQREDDRPEAIKVRLETYERSAAPLIDFYAQRHLLVRVPATGSPEEICERTVAEIEPRRIKGFATKLWAAAENRRDT